MRRREFITLLGGAIFEEPTGWQKVDRQLQEMRQRLDCAETEEQFQGVGLLCREVLISVAQEVYDPARHPLIDDKIPSNTDAKRPCAEGTWSVVNMLAIVAGRRRVT
jgi:hypothetical protein